MAEWLKAAVSAEERADANRKVRDVVEATLATSRSAVMRRCVI